jgi:hypothetical protein
MPRNSPDWEAVESAWHNPAVNVDSLGVLQGVALRHRRQRTLVAVEVLISLVLLALAVIAVREHPSAGVWLWSAALGVHAVGLWWIGLRSRAVAQRALNQPTAMFLRSWRAACRRQLVTVRTGLTLLALEALLLILLLTSALAGAPQWGLRIIPAERLWFVALILALSAGAWLVSVRTQTLVELERASRLQADLETAGP